jgi:outer membrane receptor protein involved in Fe transport
MPLRRSVAFCVAIALPLPFADAHAQAPQRPADDDTLVLETVVVEGELQSRELQEAATSAAVFRGDDIEAGTEIDLYDLLERTPNAQSSFGEKGFAIRGIDQRGVGTSGGGQLVAITVDGASLVNQSTFFGPYSAWDLGQVEVLRGPQSTQRGRNALAGAIIVRSADPVPGEFTAKARLAGGSYGTRRAAAAVNSPLLDDRLTLRASFEDYRTDGWVENPTLDSDDYDARKAQTGRLKIAFQPAEHVDALLTLVRAESFGGEDLIDLADWPRNRFNRSDLEAREGSEHDIATLEVGFALGERWRVESVSNLYRNDYVRVEDFDFTPEVGNFIDRRGEDRTRSQDLSLRFEGDRADGVFGVYWTQLEADIDESFESGGSIIGLPNSIGIRRDLVTTDDTTNRAVYGEVDWRLDERWALTLGGRYDDETNDQFIAQAITITPPVIPVPNSPGEVIGATYSAFLPKAAVRFAFSDAASLAVTVQEAYRAGGFSLSPVSGEGGAYDPERATNYEVAFRSLQADGRMRLNANAFYLDWTDQQVAVPGSTGRPNDVFTVNAGESKVYGAELSVDWRIAGGLVAYAAAGWTETEFTDFATADFDYAGNRFPGASRLSMATGFDWAIADRWQLGVDFSAREGYFFDAENRPENRVGGRGILNAKLGYVGDAWSLDFVVRNFADKDYLLQRSNGFARSGEPRIAWLEWNWRL